MSRHFTIVMVGRNIAQFLQRSLESALGQKHNNFSILVFDDCSTDGSLYSYLTYEKKYPQQIRVIQNTQRHFTSGNYYQASKLINDKSIVVWLDADDWLFDDYVLQYLDSIYQPNTWITGGSQIDDPPEAAHIPKFPHKKVLPNYLRSGHRFMFTLPHLRSFRIELLKLVSPKDYRLSDGTFAPTLGDVYVLNPMIEMAAEKCVFIDKALYVYNRNNQYSGPRFPETVGQQCWREFLARPKYRPVKSLSDCGLY